MSDARPLPINWSATTLADVIACLESGSRPRGGVSGIDSGVTSLGGEHLGVLGGFRFDKMRFVPEEFASRQTKGWIKPGDILVVKDGATTGKVSFVGTDFPYARALLNEHVFRCAVAYPIDARFIFYWLYSAEGNRRILLDFRGAAQGGISRSFVSKVGVPVAPVPEQHRIVEAIDSYFTRVDDAVASLERVQAKLKAYRASVLKAAVEGRLVPTEASLARAEKRAYEPAERLLARILKVRRRRWEESELAKLKATGKTCKDDKWKAKYEEPVTPDTSNLPALPEGWCWANADQVGEILLGRQRSQAYLTGRWYRPYLRVANIKDDHISLDDVERMDFDPVHYEKYRLVPGDILVSEGQSPHLVGQSAIYRGGVSEFCFQKTLHRFRPVPGAPTSEFAQIVFRANVMLGVFKKVAPITTNIAHLTLEKFKASRFPLPPAPEQERIVGEVERLLSVAEAMQQQVRREFSRLRRLRQSALKWAFEGKLVNQDPNDEPADVLLARLRAERLAAASTMKKSFVRTAKGAG